MRFLLVFLCVPLVASFALAQENVALRTIVIDGKADEGDRFLCVRADTMGRLFVGSSHSLYVYEPNARGAYQPRKLLYRFPERSWVNDIEVRGDDLYVLTSSALYLFADGVHNREGLLPRKLIWGVPGGLPFTGFQRLAWGPEGDLYFSVGGVIPQDRWAYWTFFSQPEGTKTPYRGVGGIFRCKPGGSNLQVVAHGLRHPGSLAFDRHWNLFTSNFPTPKSMQLCHVAPHAWLDSLPPMLAADGDTFTAGPVCYDGTRHLVMSSQDKVSRLSIEPRGASFKAAIVGLTYTPGGSFMSAGRGGRLFAIVNQKLILLTTLDGLDAHPAEPYEAGAATPERLWKEMSDPLWLRRYRAHIEIVRRGGDLLKEANKRLLGAKASDPATHHLIWLAAQSGQGSLHLLALVDHGDPLVRVQAIRALTEFPEQLRGEPIFTKLLLDEHPQVRHAAVLALLSPKIDFDRPAQQAIERGPARDKDPLLRQSAALLLAQKATFKQIEAMCGRSDEAMRLAGVLAAGYRLTLPPTTASLAQHLPLREDGNTRIEYADGKRDLRDHGRVGTFTIAEHWKADKHSEEEYLLLKLLRRMAKDEDAEVRGQAAVFLRVLDDPRK